MSESSRPTAVVTGANGGIGLETARGLAARGYHVVLLCRNPDRASAAKADIDASVPGASTETLIADLGIQSDVRRAAKEIEQSHDRLELLVNNAGIQLRKLARTPEGHDMLLAVNHLGPFLLTNLLVPLLRSSAPARVVNVASDAHRMSKLHLESLDRPRGYGLIGMPGYGETKLMNILFTRDLARRLEGTGVTVNSVHPGSVYTNLGDPPRAIKVLLRPFFRTAEEGAKTSLFVATDPSLDGVTGKYFANSKLAENKLSKQAQSDELGAELWRRSEQLVGLADAPAS
jgi:NAD(P)-dependent dehydrogenase (short-subunit alcohol dehydrogenase family)